MNYRAIIKEAWSITQENKKVIWWFAFIPAVISSLVSILYMAYQFAAFWTSEYFREDAEASITEIGFGVARDLFEYSPGLFVFLLVIAAIVGLAYLFLPVFTQGALIQLMAHLRKGIDVSIPQGLSFGFNRFLQLFEYSAFIKTFSFIAIASYGAFFLRSLGPNGFMLLGMALGFALIVGIFLTLLFTYAEFYIVIDKEGVFPSIIKSSSLVVQQWHHTLFMFMLMLIISLRIIFNIVVALLVPLLVMGPILLFASSFKLLGIIIGALIGLVALYAASYFMGVFNVFATGVWTFTFLELTSADEVDLRN